VFFKFFSRIKLYLVIVMTMALLRDESVESYLAPDNQVMSAVSSAPSPRAKMANVPMIEAKLRRPDTGGAIVQHRLLELLGRSARNHSGTLVVGRAGSGKTTLAAEYAAGVAGSVWYSIDAGDADWHLFAKYFTALILGKSKARNPRRKPTEARTPLELFADLTAGLELVGAEWPTLLVLDGAHHLFDSEWFPQFFQFMIASMQPPTHVLVLSRSKPPTPLWRLRSKQVLNVIDEKVLAFSPAEADEFFARHGLGKREAASAHKLSFGQAGKLAGLLDSRIKNQSAR